MSPDQPAGRPLDRDGRTAVLVRIATLIVLGGSAAAVRDAVADARAVGVGSDEVVDLLGALAPTIGLAGTVAAAPVLAKALGVDVDGPLEALDDDGTSPP